MAVGGLQSGLYIVTNVKVTLAQISNYRVGSQIQNSGRW